MMNVTKSGRAWDEFGHKQQESDYPWGGELQFIANDSNHYKFAGNKHDTETNLDYFSAQVGF